MLPERIRKSMDAWFDKDYRATFYERIDCLLESEARFEGLAHPLRYGRTLQYSLDRISVFIQEGERIVGSIREIIPSPEQKERAESQSKAWWSIPPEEIQKRILWFYSYGWLKRRPPWFYSFGHLALDWEGIIAEGLGAFSERASSRLTRGGAELTPAQKNFLEGAAICVDSISAYILRYAAEAEGNAARSSDPEARAELSRMAASLARISRDPPRGFREALQLIWLLTLPLMKVAGCGVLNFSRIDQYLLPFYRDDI